MTDIPLCPAGGAHEIDEVTTIAKDRDGASYSFLERRCAKCGLRDTFIPEGEPEDEEEVEVRIEVDDDDEA